MARSPMRGAPMKHWYNPRLRLPQDAEPADAPVCKLLQRALDLRDRYPGQSRQVMRDLIRYLTAIPPPDELV